MPGPRSQMDHSEPQLLKRTSLGPPERTRPEPKRSSLEFSTSEMEYWRRKPGMHDAVAPEAHSAA
eukprot:13422445-Alexandrium_andersonii.AAC.1